MNNDISNTELNIRIDRLILEGIVLTSYQQQELKEAVETELAGMFRLNGVSSAMSSLPEKIRGDMIHLRDSTPAPEQLGKQIAHSIYHGLTGEAGHE